MGLYKVDILNTLKKHYKNDKHFYYYTRLINCYMELIYNKWRWFEPSFDKRIQLTWKMK